MNRKRVLAISILLALIGFVAFFIVLSSRSGPTYQGKSVKYWFKKYVTFRNAGVTTVFYDSSGRILYDAQNRRRLPDPAWDALRALGSNAVPYLANQVHSLAWECQRSVKTGQGGSNENQPL